MSFPVWSNNQDCRQPGAAASTHGKTYNNTKEKGTPMTKDAITIRLMTENDLDAILKIDEKILNSSRLEYYQFKFERLFSSGDYLPTSFVAEDDGTVVGFLMGELYMGEFGPSRTINLERSIS